MERLVYIAVDGVIFASWLFLVSLGLTFIYGVLRVLNVAHGSLYALGAYMGSSLVLLFLRAGYPTALSYLVLLGAALLIGLTVGPFLERVFLRRIYLKEEVLVLLLTFAISLMLEDVIKLVWGVEPYLVNAPYLALGQVKVAGVAYAVYPFLLTGIAVAAGTLVWATMARTRFGRLVVSVIEDREISAASGVNVPLVFTFAFTLGAILAALGGAFTAPMISVVPGVAVEVIVLAFAVAAIGGLGSIEGAAIGALLVGLLRAAAVHLAPELDLLAIYAVMALVLLVRPYGLFGRAEVRRI